MIPRAQSRACCWTLPSLLWLDDAESRIKGLQKVSEDVVLSGLVRCEDIVAAAEEVINKFDFGTD
jgi:hypothetical protein